MVHLYLLLEVRDPFHSTTNRKAKNQRGHRKNIGQKYFSSFFVKIKFSKNMGIYGARPIFNCAIYLCTCVRGSHLLRRIFRGFHALLTHKLTKLHCRYISLIFSHLWLKKWKSKYLKKRKARKQIMFTDTSKVNISENKKNNFVFRNFFLFCQIASCL